MRTKIQRILLFISIGVCVGVGVWSGIVGRVRGATTQSNRNRPILSKLPPIKNCVEHVKLVNAELIMQGEDQAAALEIENTAYIGVVSISVEQMANNAKNGVTKSGFTPDKPPIVIIAPGARQTITLGLEGNSPLRIGAAIFSDGTEEGCAASLKTIRDVKAHDTNRRPQQ